MALLAPWLADFQLLAAALLLGVMLAIALLRQPAQRLAVAKSTLVALAALALLCAIPGWSLVHLLNEPPAPAPVASLAPLADITPAAPTPPPLPFEPVAAAPSPVVTTIETPPTPPPAEPINWPAAIVTLYAAGCALVALWLAIGGLLARRVFSQATPTPPEFEQLLAQITGPVARPPQLLLSRHIAAPVAMGLRRPAILLPLPRREGQGEGFPTHSLQSEAQLLPILAHEWAHLEHRDLHTLAATRLLLILLWPQPLFWLLRRTIRLDQETLADAAAADRAGRLDYAQQLLAWARTASTQRPPRLAGAVGLWEGPSQLKRRIAVLLNEKFSVMRSCSRRWRASSLLAIALMAIGLSTITFQPRTGVANEAAEEAPDVELSLTETVEAELDAAPEKAPPPAAYLDPMTASLGHWGTNNKTPNVIRGRCVDDANQPIADVEVQLYRGKRPSGVQRLVTQTKTNAAGEYEFTDVIDPKQFFPDGVVPANTDPNAEMFTVITRQPGRVSREVLADPAYTYREGLSTDVLMPAAAVLSGIVKDEQGQPIAGARVSRYSLSDFPEAFSAVSDSTGRFSISDLAPFDLAAEKKRKAEEQRAANARLAAGADSALTVSLAPRFTVVHPDFSTKQLPPSSVPSNVDVTLSPGARLRGRVLLTDGSPAANATVMVKPSVPKQGNGDWGMIDYGKYVFERDYHVIVPADAEGNFEVGALTPGKVDVWAELPGWLNAGVGEFEVKTGQVESLPQLTLTKGGTIRLRLIDDETGRPIPVDKPLAANVSVIMKNKLGRQETWPERKQVSEQGVVEIASLPGTARLMLQSVDAGKEQLWMPASNDWTASPQATVIDGEAVDVEVRVRKTPQAEQAQAKTSADVAAPAESELQKKEVAERGSALAKQVTPGPNVFMGFCIDEAARPVADVDVSLFIYNGSAKENVEPLARTRTGADGKFEFNRPVDIAKEFPNGVPDDHFVTAPVKVIAAVAKAPGLTTEFQNEVLHRFVKRGQGAMLQMKPAQKLIGRVTGEKGQPVVGAVVNATLSVGGYVPGASLSARTDADGRYTIDDLPRFDADERIRELAAARERKEPWAMFAPPGPAVSVQHPDFATRRVNLQVVPGELNLALLPGSTVKGRVVAKLRGPSDESKPLANVPVWIMRTMQPIRDPNAAYGLLERQQTTTDPEGNYMFSSLPASEYAVTATAPDLTTAGVTGISVGVDQTAAAHDVVLTPGAVVRVKVLNAVTNQPLPLSAGQKGYILPERLTPGVVGAPRMDSQIAEFTADAVGETRLAPGRYRLFVSIPGEGLAPNFESHSPDGKSTIAEFEVREGETLELDAPLSSVPLQKASGVTAIVQPAVADSADVETQASPQPVTSYFQPSTTRADGEHPGAVPVQPQVDIPAIDGSTSPETKTPATTHPVAPPRTTHKTLGMGKVTAVTLEQPKHQPNALELHIVDENDQPLAGVEATLYSVMPPGNEAKPIKTLATDGAGNAVFANVAPADQVARFAALKAAGEFIGGSREMYLIALKHPGLATALLYQSAGELALGGSKRTIILRPAVKLSGRVTDSAGEPVADALVTAGGFSGNLSIAGVNAVATDAAGQFEFNDRGPFDRAAANKDSNAMSLNFTAANSPTVQLSPVVEDPTVKNVSDLVVTHPKFAVTRVEGGDVPGVADVQLLPATSIVGRVINHQSGAAAAGVTVQAMGDPTGPPQLEKKDNVLAFRLPYSHSASVRTDAQGNYHLDNLPAGTYNLWIDSESTPGKPFKQASQGASGVVTKAGSEPTEAPNIIVGPPATVTVQLVDAETGKPLQLDGNAVAVPMALRGSDYRQQQNPHQRAPISKEGTFTFSSLPGRFRIGVEVVDKPGFAYQAIYRSNDDFDRSAAVIDLHFGESVSTKLAVRPMAQLEQLRAEHGKAFSLLQAKKFDEAIAAFDAMVAARPNDYEPISSRCYAYRTAARYAEAIADAEVMLERFPEDSQGKFVLADLLATSPIAETRDGKRALKYAEELVATTKASRAAATTMAQCLSFEAAAYAELGEFAKAMAAQQQALDLVPSSHNESAHRTLAERLELYRANKPFHRVAPSPTTPPEPSADQGAATSPRVAPLSTKLVDSEASIREAARHIPATPVEFMLSGTLNNDRVQLTPARATPTASIEKVDLINLGSASEPWSYPMGGLDPKPSSLEFKSATLGDAVK